MLKFTNSKALTLSAMLVLGATTAFGQVTDSKWTGVDAPTPQSVKFPILYSTTSASVPALPGGAVAEGVYYHGIDKAGVVYVPTMGTAKPEGNETQTSFWKEGDKLGVFLGDEQKGEVLINLSTKYLKNFKDLSLKLASDNLGKTAYATAEWSIEVSVYDVMNGNILKKSDLYTDGDNTDAEFSKEIFSTLKDDPMTVNLFSTVEDPITDLKNLKEGALNNKFIQIKLTSKPVEIVITEDGSRSHFAPALVISDFNYNFDHPSMGLVVDKTTLEAGKGRTSCETGTLTLTAENFAYPANAKVSDVFVYTPALSYQNTPELDAATFKAQSLFNGADQVDAVSAPYDFKPLYIGNRPGNFIVKLKEDGPIRMDAASAQVFGNSTPELVLDKNHISFYKSDGQTQTINIVSGKNIPAGEALTFKATEKETTDQEGKYGEITIDNSNIAITSCGGVSGLFTATLKQDINDITRPEAWTIAVANAKDNVTYPTTIAVAGVGALWLTYEGLNFDGTTAKYEADNVFFSAYDANDDLAGDRKQSRVKTYMLHGSELKATQADGIAVIKIKMEKEGDEQNTTDNQEFRFRVDESKPWTNSNMGVLEVKVNTLSDKEMKEFREQGKPIYVQFVPNKDGFVMPGTTEENIKWTPDTYRLTAMTTVAGFDVATTAAGLFGDTRANLWSNMNKMQNIDIMHNSTANPFGNLNLKYPEFQKNYGKDYLDGCPYDNVLGVSKFYVAGYNLEKAVKITKNLSGSAPFKYTIVNKLTGDDVTGNEVMPNKYGEVLAEVTVTFAPNAKPATGHKTEDFFTVTSGERVITKGGQLAPEGSDVSDIKDHPTVSSLFDYKKYSDKAEVFGFVYVPTLTIDMPESMTAYAGDAAKTAQVTITGTDFDPLTDGKSTIELSTLNGTSFKLKNVTNRNIDINGNLTATATLEFTPNNMCEGLDNSVVATVGCKTIEQAVAGKVYWNSKAPELVPMNYSDIDGHTAILNWKPVAGAEYYIVKVGHMKPIHVSKNVFISEVRASEADNTLAVELFNGTATVINPQMLVNYYLKVTVTNKAGKEDVFYGHFTNTDINAIATNGGWENKALIVKDYHADNDYNKVIDGTARPVSIAIGEGLSYKVQLMEGANQIDVFAFGAAGAHLSRLANVANLEMNKGDFNIADWETTNTSLLNTEGRAYFVWQEDSNFELSVADGAESMAIVPEGNMKDGKITTKVYNLNNNSLYDVMVTAYNKCLVNEDGEPMSSTNGYVKDFIKTSVSGQEPTGDVSFEYNGSATGNDPISANAFKVVTGKSSVTIYNAAGKKAVVRNILGQPIAETVISSDNATIAAPAGIVTVAVEGETTVKAIVK